MGMRQGVARRAGRTPTVAGRRSAGKMSAMPDPAEPHAGKPRSTGRRGDVFFKGLTTASGISIVVAIVAIAVFLLVQAVPSLRANTVNFFTYNGFVTRDVTQLQFGIRSLLIVTVLSSLFALVLAVPIAVGIALFVTNYASRKVAKFFGSLVDLLAAVPSIVFGLWGILVLAPAITPVAEFLNRHLSWFFLFSTGNVSVAGGGTIFTAGIVLAVMILPIITAVTREVFRQTPQTQVEAAQALGATKWEMIRMTVLPFGRSGTIAASMLGLGRALGETVAVLIILRSSSQPAGFSLFGGGYTFASKIASAASEFVQPLSTGAFIAAGFVLFVLTFVVNAIARAVAGGKVNG